MTERLLFTFVADVSLIFTNTEGILTLSLCELFLAYQKY